MKTHPYNYQLITTRLIAGHKKYKFNIPYFFMVMQFTLFPHSVHAHKPDCIIEAAECFQINPLLIKAIIWNESKNNQKALNINDNKTIDVGVMQINTVHFGALKKMGIDDVLLRENSCANVYSGTWILKQSIERYGYTWKGVGNYHSKSPFYRDRYINKLTSSIANEAAMLNNIEIIKQDGIRELFRCHR